MHLYIQGRKLSGFGCRDPYPLDCENGGGGGGCSTISRKCKLQILDSRQTTECICPCIELMFKLPSLLYYPLCKVIKALYSILCLASGSFRHQQIMCFDRLNSSFPIDINTKQNLLWKIVLHVYWTFKSQKLCC